MLTCIKYFSNVSEDFSLVVFNFKINPYLFCDDTPRVIKYYILA